MKENYFSQVDDYGEPFCEQQYMHESCLFVCSNSDPLISLIPQTASNFKHLFSCGTVVSVITNTKWNKKIKLDWHELTGTDVHRLDFTQLKITYQQIVISSWKQNK